jgi:hypothetical protein
MNASDDMKDFLNSVPAMVVGNPETIKTPAAPVKDDQPHFPCFECAGTGKWRRTSKPCFACKGKGYFLTSKHDRDAAKKKSADKKAATLEAAKASFNEANPGLIEGLREIASWHNFAANMLQAFEQWGGLTPNQLAAAQKTLIKVREKQAERDAAKAANTGEVDVTKIAEAFAIRMSKPFRKLPSFITERLVISAASPRGANPGGIYVKCDGIYSGKIVNNVFKPTSAASKEVLELIRNIAASPLEAAVAYGKRTGTCSCCGRELTDPASIDAGIGPVCAEKWGF